MFLDNVSSAEMRRFYPEEARKAKLEADVRVKLLVDEQGQVARATLVSDPSGAFGRAALKVARLYRFKPARLNDRRVATEIAFVIHFELN
ncbi:MAG: energy transducer TonB [Pseudomonadota bacterium]